MDCKEACRRIVMRLWSGQVEDPQLEAHLAACADCRARLQRYRAVGEVVRELQADRFPPEAEESLREALDRAVAIGPDPKLSPASPRPERSPAQKAAIAVLAIALLVGVTVAILMLSLEKRDLPPTVGKVLGRWGKLYVEMVAPLGWRELNEREPLRPGTTLRTEFDALARIRSGSVEWVLDGSTTVQLSAPGQARLVRGRAAGRLVGEGAEPLVLRTPQGKVSSDDGVVVAAISRFQSVRVDCAAGTATLLEDVRLEAGQCALLVDAAVRRPVRKARVAEMTHWLRAVGDEGHPPLRRRWLASVPLLQERPLLPDHVGVPEMNVSVALAGALALVRVDAALHNTGTKAWSGELGTASMVLPPALVEATASVELPAGGRGRCAAASLHVARERDGRCVLGLCPQAWTNSDIGRMSIAMDAQAESGFELVSCPTHRYQERGVPGAAWSWQGEGVPSTRPVVFECVPRRAKLVDVMAIQGAGSPWLVGAWRPAAVRSRWFGGWEGLVFALDVNGDFGRGGRCSAHEVAERIVRAVPRRGGAAVVAWDGQVRLYPVLLGQAGLREVEGALAALWETEKAGRSAPGEFLNKTALAACTPDGNQVLVCVAGRDAPGEDGASVDILRDRRARLVVVQVGVDWPSIRWRRLCGQSRGLCTAVPAAMSPRLGAADVLWDLRNAPLTGVSIELPEGVAGRLVPAEGSPAGQPVVALVRLPSEEVGAEPARIAARVWRLTLVGQMPLGQPDTVLDGPLARQMAEKLSTLSDPGGM